MVQIAGGTMMKEGVHGEYGVWDGWTERREEGKRSGEDMVSQRLWAVERMLRIIECKG